MIPLAVVVGHELHHRVSQGCVPEEDHRTQTFFFEGKEKSFCERIQIRTSRRQSNDIDALPDEKGAERVGIFRVSFENGIRYRVPCRNPSFLSVMLRAIYIIHAFSG